MIHYIWACAVTLSFSLGTAWGWYLRDKISKSINK